MRAGVRGLALRAVGATLAVMLACFTPSAAQAACGDHVHYGDKGQPGNLADSPAPMPQPHQPCHGPHCSRSDERPFSAPATRLVVEQDDTCIVAPPSLPEGDRADLMPPSTMRCPLASLSPIYRPPRHS